MPRKHEHHISPEDYLCRSPQNDQDNAHADNYNTSRQLERNISPEYWSRSQDDQDSSSDEYVFDFSYVFLWPNGLKYLSSLYFSIMLIRHIDC